MPRDTKEVYVDRFGEVYHDEGNLAAHTDMEKMMVPEADAAGAVPCSRCFNVSSWGPVR